MKKIRRITSLFLCLILLGGLAFYGFSVSTKFISNFTAEETPQEFSAKKSSDANSDDEIEDESIAALLSQKLYLGKIAKVTAHISEQIFLKKSFELELYNPPESFV